MKEELARPRAAGRVRLASPQRNGLDECIRRYLWSARDKRLGARRPAAGCVADSDVTVLALEPWQEALSVRPVAFGVVIYSYKVHALNATALVEPTLSLDGPNASPVVVSQS